MLRERGSVDNRRLIDRASEQRSIDRADLYIDPTDLAKLGLGGSDITPTNDTLICGLSMMAVL